MGYRWYELDAATIINDRLTITASYRGGCETHQFTLVASAGFLESYPVQLSVSIAHNANGDLCEGWVTEEYDFDLTPIKMMYQEAYGEDAGTMILRLENAPDLDLVYTFAS